VADQRALLRLALASTDRLFLEHMYRAMLELGLDEELLQVRGYAAPHSSLPLSTSGSSERIDTGSDGVGDQKPEQALRRVSRENYHVCFRSRLMRATHLSVRKSVGFIRRSGATERKRWSRTVLFAVEELAHNNVLCCSEVVRLQKTRRLRAEANPDLTLTRVPLLCALSLYLVARTRLQLGGAALERFLAAEGAADAPADAPLTSQQASCLGLLVQAYQRTGQHARAAAVLLRLAEQRPAEGAEVVDLEARIHLLDQAALQVQHTPTHRQTLQATFLGRVFRSLVNSRHESHCAFHTWSEMALKKLRKVFAGWNWGLQARAQPLAQGGELVNHIQLKQTLVGLQRTLWERLRQRAAAAAETDSDAAAAAALTAAAESLRTDLKSLEELYNVYAQVREESHPTD
jgi:hypothetical protein